MFAVARLQSVINKCIPSEQKAQKVLLFQVEVGEGEEAVLECGVKGLASIHMVCKIALHVIHKIS